MSTKQHNDVKSSTKGWRWAIGDQGYSTYSPLFISFLHIIPVSIHE
jgi:hypothetical protein